MNTNTNYPDGITAEAVSRHIDELSQEIASPHAPTAALLDGTAADLRNARILARAAAGITPKYGVTLAQAVREESAPLRAVPITNTLPTPVYGRRKRKGRRARRNAVRAQFVTRTVGHEAA